MHQEGIIIQIEFEFSGGYAGIIAKYTANIDELPKNIAEELLRLINDSEIFDIKQSDVTHISGPPDVFFYKLSLHNDKRISLAFNDMTIPTKVHPLLSKLRELALGQHR